MSALREHLHRFWIRFDPADDRVGQQSLGLGSGVTAVSQADAEDVLTVTVFAGAALPPIVEVIVDVDLSTLDAGHVLPNSGDPSIRGVWYPRV